MKLIILVLTMFLVGCSIISPPTYHETEYAQLIEIAALALESQCTPEQNQQLSKLSTRVALYSKYLPHNELMAKSAEEMDKTIQSLKRVAPESPACFLRLHVINAMALTMADAVGGKSK